MQGAPPVNGFVDDGDVYEANDGEDGPSSCTGRGAAHVAAQHDVGDVDEPEDESGGQTGIPCPPCSPGGTPPDGTGEQGEGDEDGPYFSGSTGEPVPALVFLPEVGNACDSHDAEGEHADPCDGDVEVEDTLGDTFNSVGGDV